jgi:hypothetical protein
MEPTSKPIPDEAPATIRAAPEAPNEPVERPEPRKGSSKRLEDLRATALSRAQSGAPREALNAAAEGLRIDARDPALNNLVATLLRDAQASARRAREEAVDADAVSHAEEQFQQALKRERSAVNLQRAGKLDAATRGYWGAAELFTAALTEAREAAQEEKAAADREKLRPKAPERAPAPAPGRLNPDQRTEVERPLVDQVLRRYEAAYGSLNVDNVRIVYPSASVDQLAKDFASSRTYTLTVQVDSYQFVFTDTLTAATVVARIGHDIVPKSGPRVTRIEKAQTIQLEKEGASWIIRQIR